MKSYIRSARSPSDHVYMETLQIGCDLRRWLCDGSGRKLQSGLFAMLEMSSYKLASKVLPLSRELDGLGVKRFERLGKVVPQ